MADRYTAKDAQRCFEGLADMLGKPHGKCYEPRKDGKGGFKVGCWTLDSNPTYGGYVVNEVVNEHGGVNNPLGMRRKNAKEFCQSFFFARDVVELDRKRRGKK